MREDTATCPFSVHDTDSTSQLLASEKRQWSRNTAGYLLYPAVLSLDCLFSARIGSLALQFLRDPRGNTRFTPFVQQLTLLAPLGGGPYYTAQEKSTLHSGKLEKRHGAEEWPRSLYSEQSSTTSAGKKNPLYTQTLAASTRFTMQQKRLSIVEQGSSRYKGRPYMQHQLDRAATHINEGSP